jgi:hypothetical protein
MAKKLTRAEKMRRFIASNPEMTVAQVAAEFGVKYQIAYMAKRSMGKVKKDKEWVSAMIATSNASIVDKVSGLTPAQTAEKVFHITQGRVRNAFSEETPTGIDATLAERGHKYGKFKDHAAITYKMKNLLRAHALEHGKSFAFDQAEALDMICHKLGRIVNGDPNYADSWVDIAGYAKLVADRLESGKTV